MVCIPMRTPYSHAPHRMASSFRIHHPIAVAHVDAVASTIGISYRICKPASLDSQERVAD